MLTWTSTGKRILYAVYQDIDSPHPRLSFDNLSKEQFVELRQFLYESTVSIRGVYDRLIATKSLLRKFLTLLFYADNHA